MRGPLPASVSLPDAGPETWADAPDIEFECKWEPGWSTVLGEPLDVFDHPEEHPDELDYTSWSIRFWHAFECPFATWLDTTEGRFAAFLAGRE